MRGVRGGIAAGFPAEAPGYRPPVKVREEPRAEPASDPRTLRAEALVEILRRECGYDTVAQVVAVYGVRLDDVLAEERGPSKVSAARNACYAALRAEGHTWILIGRMMGRDHSSCMAGQRQHIATAEIRPLIVPSGETAVCR